MTETYVHCPDCPATMIGAGPGELIHGENGRHIWAPTYATAHHVPAPGHTRRPLLCRLGIHRAGYSGNAHTHAPAPIRCDRCGIER